MFPFSTYRLYWPFPDPSRAEGSESDRLEVFRQVRDQIAERLQG
ncbi:hypothetical protein [Meiothermus sp. QL-1]|nr:hypothetical protein [Meiothermus sp. QL-1]